MGRALKEETRIVGRVRPGAARGRQLGFPTANLHVDSSQTRDLDSGVYLGQVYMEGKCWSGVVNIGTRPTFGASERVVEMHILDFSGDLYERQLQVEILEKLREEKRFSNADELVEQIEKDIVRARLLLNNYPTDN